MATCSVVGAGVVGVGVAEQEVPCRVQRLSGRLLRAEQQLRLSSDGGGGGAGYDVRQSAGPCPQHPGQPHGAHLEGWRGARAGGECLTPGARSGWLGTLPLPPLGVYTGDNPGKC